MGEALCTLDHIGCSAHSLALPCLFMGAKGSRTPPDVCVGSTARAATPPPGSRAPACVFYVSRLMAAGARNATDSCFTQTTRSFVTAAGNAPGAAT